MKAQQTILIAEDEHALREALATKCRAAGFTVLEAADGIEAFEQATTHQPRIILLDVQMPRMDGLSMLRKLRASGEYGQSVPVIVLTNISPNDNQVMEKVTAAEPSYYFLKADFSLEAIIEKIRELLETAE